MVQCFVPGCTSGYKSNKDKVAIYSVPKDEVSFKKWQRAIPRADLKLNKNSKVCALHFHKNMVDYKFSIIVNGIENIISRERPRLNINAVPCIFPNLPSYFTRSKKLQKPPKVRQNRKHVPCNKLAVEPDTFDTRESSCFNKMEDKVIKEEPKSGVFVFQGIIIEEEPMDFKGEYVSQEGRVYSDGNDLCSHKKELVEPKELKNKVIDPILPKEELILGNLEDEDLKSKEEEINFKEEDFLGKEDIINTEGNPPCSLRVENFQICKVIDSQRMRIPNNDSMIANKINTRHDYALLTKCGPGNSVHESQNIQEIFIRKDDTLNHSRPSNIKLKPYQRNKSDCCYDKIYSHGKYKTFQCTECIFSFSRKEHLKMHIRSVHRKLKPFKCTECDYSCSVKRCLATHIKSVHRKERPFKCMECDYLCSENGSLAKHIKSVHRKEKPFKCTECDYSCSEKRCLTRHISSVHRKLKPYKCDECDSSFSLNFGLARHIKSVHRQENPFKCTECDKAFKRNEHLLNHIKVIHIKDKAYKCAECDYSSSVKGSLARHIKLVH